MPTKYARLMAQIIKEFLCLLRDPKSRLILIVPPIVQLFVFSFAATLEVENVRLAVLNPDTGQASHKLIADIAAAPFVAALMPVTKAQEIARLINEQKVLAALILPSDFSKTLGEGRTPKVQVILDGRRVNAAQMVLLYLTQMSESTHLDLIEQSSPKLLNTRHWFNPNLTYRWFVVPSLVGILSTLIALLITALSIARERELGTFDQLLVSPCTPNEIIIAKATPAFVIGTLLASLMILMARLIFGIPFLGSFFLWLPCLMLFLVAVIGIGLMLSSVCKTQQQAILGSFAFMVPSVLTSGFAAPVKNMPIFLQYAAQMNPLKHFLIILQASFLKDLPASFLLQQALPLFAIAALSLFLAQKLVRHHLT